jgi:hypothetical protein
LPLEFLRFGRTVARSSRERNAVLLGKVVLSCLAFVIFQDTVVDENLGDLPIEVPGGCLASPAADGEPSGFNNFEWCLRRLFAVSTVQKAEACILAARGRVHLEDPGRKRLAPQFDSSEHVLLTALLLEYEVHQVLMLIVENVGVFGLPLSFW